MLLLEATWCVFCRQQQHAVAKCVYVCVCLGACMRVCVRACVYAYTFTIFLIRLLTLTFYATALNSTWLSQFIPMNFPWSSHLIFHNFSWYIYISKLSVAAIDTTVHIDKFYTGLYIMCVHAYMLILPTLYMHACIHTHTCMEYVTSITYLPFLP